MFRGAGVVGVLGLGGAAARQQRDNVGPFGVDGELGVGQKLSFLGDRAFEHAGVGDGLACAALLAGDGGRKCAGKDVGAHGARFDAALGESGVNQRALQGVARAGAAEIILRELRAQSGEALLGGERLCFRFTAAAAGFGEARIEGADFAACVADLRA